MTNIIFLCSGNTCRSPIAEALAAEVFGPSHIIASAGAETTNGQPAAENAISAMAEIGIDISDHKSTELNLDELGSYDVVVIFRPSAAESVDIPQSVHAEYIDVPDPFGSDIDVYRSAARKIQLSVRQLYVKDALDRLVSSDRLIGSHLHGVYGVAASEFEKQLHSYVKEQVDPNVYAKATLGRLARILKESGTEPDELLASYAGTANDPWMAFKHKEPPGFDEIRLGLNAMNEAYGLLWANMS